MVLERDISDTSDPYQAMAKVVLLVPGLLVADLNSEVESRVSDRLLAPRASSFTKCNDDGLLPSPPFGTCFGFSASASSPDTSFLFKVK